MKKYEKWFTKKESDSIIVPLLLRSMKDTGFNPKRSVEWVVKGCMRSRAEHSSESFYVNASYWPKDIELYANSYSALFVARIINMDSFNKKCFNESFVSNFLQYVGCFDANHTSAFKEVYLAIKKLMGLTPLNSAKFKEMLDYFSRYIDLGDIDKDPITPYQL